MRAAPAPVEDALEREVPPCDLQAERAVIGGLLFEPERTKDVLEVVVPDDFYDVKHARVMGALANLANADEPISQARVAQWLEERGGDVVGQDWRAFLAACVADASTVFPPADAARIVRAKAQARELTRLHRDALHRVRAGENAGAVLADVQARLATVQARYGDDAADARPRPRSTAQILATPKVDVEAHFWPYVVAPGTLTLFAGFPKAGKTFLLSSFLGETTRQGRWAGRAARPARVLYLTEESDVTIQPRIGRFHVGEVAWFGPGDVPVTWSWERTAAYVGDLAVAEKYDLVIVDTIRHWCRVADENDGAQMTAAMRPLAVLRARGPGVVAVHHTVKDEERRGARAFAGNAALVGAGDVLVTLRHTDEREEESNDRLLEVVGRFPEGNGSTVIRLVPGQEGMPDYYEWIGSPADARGDRVASAILDILKGERAWFTRRALAAAVRCRAEDLTRALRSLTSGPARRARWRVGTGKGHREEYATLDTPLEAPTFGGEEPTACT